jgi:pimeloyl-ACP methyl ester carboxylesterase
MTLLAATQHGSASSERTVVLLHGMLTSGRYWDPVVERLVKLADVRVIALDLLGFGRSPAPRNTRYDYGDHVDAVTRTLQALGVRGPVTVVGHSMGALIGLRLAATRPESVVGLVLVGMPVYDSRRAAREGIIQDSVLRRVMLYGVVSRLFCLLWCQALKPLSSRLAPFYVRRLPATAASASVQHSWRSYSRSLRHVVEEQHVSGDLDVVRCPTAIVNGDDDHATLTSERLPEPRAGRAIDVVRVPGDHQLPVEQPDLVARIIAGRTRDAVAEG